VSVTPPALAARTLTPETPAPPKGNSSTPSDYAGVVKFGLSPTKLTMTSAECDSRHYMLCNLSSPFLHSAVITGLAAGETYYYAISEPRCGATAPTKFTAPRAIGDAATAYPFTVFAYGDMGVTNSQPTIDLIASRVAAGTGRASWLRRDQQTPTPRN